VRSIKLLPLHLSIKSEEKRRRNTILQIQFREANTTKKILKCYHRKNLYNQKRKNSKLRMKDRFNHRYKKSHINQLKRKNRKIRKI
jgi:hypothetical protein